MRNYKNCILALLSMIAVTFASCINDGLTENQTPGAGKVASIDEQIAAVESTVEDLAALQEAADGRNATISNAIENLESHIAGLKTDVSAMEGTMATLSQQKMLAETLVTVETSDSDGALKKQIASIEKGICGWLGKNFGAYYIAAKAEAMADARLAVLNPQLTNQKISVEGILSDVEAGLRKDADKGELTALAEEVNSNADEVNALVETLAAMTAEVEAEYTQAVEAALTDPESFDAPALKQFNAGIQTKAAEADNTLEGLIARVEACETQLTDILSRLETLEDQVTDLNALLDMIQSVTFMSEFSSDYGVAYYDLDPSTKVDGKSGRTPHGTVDLSFIIRPAAAANAFVENTLWNNGLKVLGHYADKIEVKSIDPNSIIDFTINDVTVNLQTGLVKVKVVNTLDQDFYFKKKGVKMALSVATGKTDITSKFVEVIPKDYSGNVYIEALNLSSKYIEIDNGSTAKLTAGLTPSNPTVTGVVYNTSDAGVVAVSSDGVLTANSVGNATITVTTKGTDEWGNTLTETCNVKVNPAVRLSGPEYVERGGTIEIRIESPNYIHPDYITWEINNKTVTQAYVEVTKDESNGYAKVYGKDMWFEDGTYKEITVKCTVSGALPVELTHPIRVVANQPKGIAIEGLAHDQNKVTIKKGSTYTLKSSLEPESVSSEYFRIRYQPAQNWIANVDFESGVVTGVDLGTGYIDVKVLDAGSYNYFYPAREDMVRQIAVVVEPYWVESISLPATWDMKVDEEATISAGFTSDKDGVQPDDKTLTWTSDNPSVVEVDPATGKMTAKAKGTAMVTATTSGQWSVPSGSDAKSATCAVTVKEAGAADPNVGDFYYSDGTWSAERDYTKTVIGVVFSTRNATGDDAQLRADYSGCSNGLVVSIAEEEHVMGYFKVGQWEDPVFTAYYELNETTAPIGYANTKSFREYAMSKNEYVSSYEVYYAELFHDDYGVVKQHNVATPPEASSWYIPSYWEMCELYSNKATINVSISAADGEQILSENYWMSSFQLNNYKGINSAVPFNWSNGTWGSQPTSWYSVSYPVRLVLAF